MIPFDRPSTATRCRDARLTCRPHSYDRPLMAGTFGRVAEIRRTWQSGTTDATRFARTTPQGVSSCSLLLRAKHLGRSLHRPFPPESVTPEFPPRNRRAAKRTGSSRFIPCVAFQRKTGLPTNGSVRNFEDGPTLSAGATNVENIRDFSQLMPRQPLPTRGRWILATRYKDLRRIFVAAALKGEGGALTPQSTTAPTTNPRHWHRTARGSPFDNLTESTGAAADSKSVCSSPVGGSMAPWDFSTRAIHSAEKTNYETIFERNRCRNVTCQHSGGDLRRRSHSVPAKPPSHRVDPRSFSTERGGATGKAENGVCRVSRPAAGKRVGLLRAR